MKLTKQAIDTVKFRSRGKWYHAGQVDAFLEELLVAVDETERELAEGKSMVRVLTGQLESLQGENAQLRGRAEEARTSRDRLIQDIKALQDFREAFRASIERDAASVAEQLKGFSSDKLL